MALSEYRGAGHVYVGSVQEEKDVEHELVAIEGRSGSRRGRRAPREHPSEGRHGEECVEAGEGRQRRRPHATGRLGFWRDQAQAELRHAVGGREHEFIGVGLIGLAVLLGPCGVFNLAGPLGRGIETLAGWLFGLGRYAVPVVLVAVGVSLLRKGRSAGPFQLAIGWTLMSLSVLGMLQCTGAETR